MTRMTKRISYISFDSTSKEFILGALGKSIDEAGYIVEADTNVRVLDQSGDPVHIDEFGGIRKGSEIFFKKDLPTVLSAIQSTSGSANG